eukprot:c14261_g2_i2.p1 GENE.c14261_g2_i2~~c14261_g2_i2.p1  ORF type:complete len:472 (+),score=111.40 c14261_g2_i2:33-1418(+)
MDEVLLYSGQLSKKGRMSGKWVSRHYELIRTKLSVTILRYFNAEGDSQPIGTFLIDRAVSVIPRTEGGLHGFILIIEDHSHALFARNLKDSSRWIAVLESAIQFSAGTTSDGSIVINLGTKSLLLEEDDRLHSSQPTITEPKMRHTSTIDTFYRIENLLGEGGNSVVYRGVDLETSAVVALKMIARDLYKANKKTIDEEIMIMAACVHKNIIRMYEVVYTRSHLVIALEILEGEELFSRIVKRDQYTEEDAKRVATSVLLGVEYLHSHGIVHCDLKPENLIFDKPGEDATLKIADFGLSSLMPPNGKLSRFCGTPQYTAPEMLERRPYDQAVDMWSCGVIFYVLLCGYPPFYAPTDILLGYKIVNGKFKFHDQNWSGISEEAKDLISKLLEVNPRKRLTIKQALEHPWISRKTQIHGGNLGDALIQLKRFRAARKFREVVNVLVFLNLLCDQENIVDSDEE